MSTTFRGPIVSLNGFEGPLTGNLTGEATLTSYTVATLPSPRVAGLIYVSDGAAGLPILAFSDGTNWLRSDTRAAVAAA